MLISPDHDTDSTEESEGAYAAVHDSDVDMWMEDTVDAPEGLDLPGDLDMEQGSDEEEEEHKQNEDEEEEDEEGEDEEEGGGGGGGGG